MLSNIKSIFIIKHIFLYIKEELKLKLINYNKALQNKININLTNYKFFSGKYIIFETKEKGKEYNAYNDNLLFEGEYLNGKRNGKGKEYYYDEIIFNGEYKNGKRNGSGKEYEFSNLIFKGEYLNGKKWNGIGYYNIDILEEENFPTNNSKEKIELKNNKIYEIKNGKGFVKEYYDKNLIFEGDYKNGERNGKGKEYNRYGNIIYEGEYLNGKRWNGKGLDTKGNIVYELKNGQGIVKEYYFNNKIKYECELKNGEKNGKGKEYYINDKLEYIGEYKNGKRHRKGKEYNYNGNLLFEGIFLYNNRFIGKEYTNNRIEYEGEYLFNKKWKGKGYDENGNIIYELKNGSGPIKYYTNNNLLFDGFVKNGKKDGKCKEYGSSKELIFEGEYKNNKRNGKGKEYNYNGKLIFDGEYIDGIKWKGKIYEYDKKDDLIFEGEYMKGEKNGHGKIIRKNKIIFEGEFLNGKRWNGNGYDNKGNKIYDLKNGNGFVIEHNPDNSISFEGNYINGEKNGYIKEYDHSGQLIFEGEYANGKRNGKGKEYIYKEVLLFPFTFFKINKYMKIEKNNNYVNESYFENDSANDFNNNDISKNLIYEGEYKNGLRNGKGKEYLDGKLIT